MSESEINFLQSQIELLKNKLKAKEQENQELVDLITQLRRKSYGSSSEQVSSEQLGMFDEAESEALKPEIPDEETVTVDSHQRKVRGKREKLPESLSREVVIIDVDDKKCSSDGAELKCIGEEVSEKLEIIPAKIRVIRTIRKKYACPECELFVTAKAPLELIPKSMASSSLLAYIATAKYVDGLPLYRQEAIFNRYKIDLHRQTMARWMITVGEKVEPLVKLLREELLSENYIHMDETVVQVLNEEGKKAQSTSYMWVQARSGEKPIILFHYGRNRSAKHASMLLEDYKGYLQVDGYDGYAPAIKKNGLTRLGCWAHARRKFFDAFKSSKGSQIGKQGLVYFKKIYEMEDKIKYLSPEEKFIQRLKESVPLVKKFKDWIEEKIKVVTPSSLAGQALKYATNEWEYLMNCFSDGGLKLDNNFIESHIRPFAIGRKNWMFSASTSGATASANIYSLVETAKANGIEPFEYLHKVFKKLPSAETEKDFLDLLPIKLS